MTIEHFDSREWILDAFWNEANAIDDYYNWLHRQEYQVLIALKREMRLIERDYKLGRISQAVMMRDYNKAARLWYRISAGTAAKK